jgi:hypothetical protein
MELDKILAWFLKIGAPILAKLLSDVFNLSNQRPSYLINGKQHQFCPFLNQICHFNQQITDLFP